MIQQSHWNGETKPLADVAGIGDEPLGVEALTNTKDEVALKSIVDAVDKVASGVIGMADADVVNEGTKPDANPAEASEQPRQEVGPFAVEKGGNLGSNNHFVLSFQTCNDNTKNIVAMY